MNEASVESSRRRVPVPERSIGFLLGELCDHWSIGEAAAAVEDSGAGAFWVVDHLLWHRPMPECFASVAMAAAATRRIAVGPCVLQVPLRNPVEIAKWSTFMHHATGGRFVLGVGVGEHEGEYRRVGADFRRRGRSLEEALDAIGTSCDGRLLGTAYERRYRLDPSGRFPIWVGGRSPASIRRAARRGDGWIPHFVDPGELSRGRERLEREAEEEGRDPDQIVLAATVFASVEDDSAEHERNLSSMARLFDLPDRALRKRLIAGTAAEVARSFEAYWNAGAQHLAVMIFARDPLERFLRLVSACTGDS